MNDYNCFAALDFDRSNVADLMGNSSQTPLMWALCRKKQNRCFPGIPLISTVKERLLHRGFSIAARKPVYRNSCVEKSHLSGRKPENGVVPIERGVTFWGWLEVAHKRLSMCQMREVSYSQVLAWMPK